MQYVLSKRAEQYVRRLDQHAQARIAAAIRAVAENPFHRGTKALQGTGQPSVRVGGWRIIYLVNQGRGLVEVDAIAPRGQVYRDL